MAHEIATSTFVFGLLLASSLPASSEGVLVVGQHPEGVARGYAYSFQVNHPSTDAATKVAMEGCVIGARKHKFATNHCKVVQAFKEKCVALAMDPKDGTPGVGWGVEATRELAEKIAMAKCEATAGSTRASFCKIDTKTSCDGVEAKAP